VLIRGLILLVVIAVALFAALRAFTKSGQAQPACDPGQACVTTDKSLPGGWPSNPNQP
jgi:predicted lipid-binding transport protein (Tim44 family)